MKSHRIHRTKPKEKQRQRTEKGIDEQSIPIYYQNIRSVPAKDKLHRALMTTIYEVICLTETWFTANHKSDNYIPQRFNVFRLDRNECNSEFNRGGGVAVLVENKHRCKRLDQYENPEIEGMCVEIKINKTTLIVYLAYVPELENGRDEVFRKHAACIERILTNTTLDVIVLGDLNMRDVHWESAESGNHLIPRQIPSNQSLGFGNFLCSLQLLSLQQRMHIKNDSGNILDLVFARENMDIMIYHAPATITNAMQIDTPHPPIKISLMIAPHYNTKVEFVETLAYSRGNYVKMMQELDAINFAAEFHHRSIEQAFEFFYDKLNTIITNNVSTVKFRVFCNKPKWWNKDLQKLKNKRNKEWKRRNADDEQYAKVSREFNELYELLHN